MRELYGNNFLDFFYDANGYPYAVNCNGILYFYITNLQGDVVSLMSTYGVIVGTYEYDPYGNVISQTGDIAAMNPLRHRGYYYDTDLEMYYCLSRYYDPAIGRWINADEYASTGQGVVGFNMFAYCNNNPVNLRDLYGEVPEVDWEEIYEKTEELVEIFLRNIEGTAAIGLGLEIEIVGIEYLNATVGIKYDLARTTYNNGQSAIYQYYSMGFELTIATITVDAREEGYRMFYNDQYQWIDGTHPLEKSTHSIAGGGIYLVGGLFGSIGVDSDSLFKDTDEWLSDLLGW